MSERKAIDYWMYNDLKEEIARLKSVWENECNGNDLRELTEKTDKGDCDRNDFNRYMALLIDASHYQKAIDEINEFKEKLPIYMTEYNQLGVCYERLKNYHEAYECYKIALGLMISSKEFNDVIISNYVKIIDKVNGLSIDDKEFEFLKELFNISLCNHFKHEIFTFKRRSHGFKYQPFNINTIDSLTNQYFYLAEKEQLNDPIEMPMLDDIGEESLICSNYRICSLTNNDNSMLMWSHYAEQHQGIMVEYWFGGELPNGVGMSKVSYDYAELRKDNQYIFNQYLLTKNKDWEYEKEVRLFSHKKSKIYYSDYSYPDINSDEINSVIASITLGLNFPKDKIQLIKSIIQRLNINRNSTTPPIELRQALLDPQNQFELIYRSVKY
ncbi:hypothetical protein MACH09_24430 [Vibrio sp. MACH09]|uniref:DUF2971 domain-containing protein n=1 Tax=Vibrio sp. MACH09 TaxID=3025122 RepID=UPI002792EDA9|nr:DUF2971 domain-containing protein [Vibrio sp. MACH09]GLO61935.1 hypothetical protein MACH09_24430 [Vibrio sp. MACH09]